MKSLSILTKKNRVFGFAAFSLFEHLFAQIYPHGRMSGKAKGKGDILHHLV